MKKGWKVFWIICIFLGVLGIALCISGMLLGATARTVRETFGFHQIREEWDGDSSSDVLHTYSRRDGEPTESYVRGGNSAWEQYFSGIREVDIDVTCVEVDICEGDDDEIFVDASDIESELRDDLIVYRKEDELKIEVQNRSKWEKIGNVRYETKGTLFIRIPSGYEFEEASVKVGAGVLNAEDLNAEELDIEVGAGQVYLNSFFAEKLDLECGAGQASVYGEAEKTVKINCGVGEVNYTAVGSQEDYDYEVSCGIGSVTVGSDTYSGLGGERKVHGSGSKKMEIECGIGVVNVSFDD